MQSPGASRRGSHVCAIAQDFSNDVVRAAASKAGEGVNWATVVRFTSFVCRNASPGVGKFLHLACLVDVGSQCHSLRHFRTEVRTPGVAGFTPEAVASD